MTNQKKFFALLEINIHYNFKELQIDHNINPKEKNYVLDFRQIHCPAVKINAAHTGVVTKRRPPFENEF